MQILGDILAVAMALLIFYKLFLVPAKVLEKRGKKLWQDLDVRAADAGRLMKTV